MIGRAFFFFSFGGGGGGGGGRCSTQPSDQGGQDARGVRAVGAVVREVLRRFLAGDPHRLHFSGMYIFMYFCVWTPA